MQARFLALALVPLGYACTALGAVDRSVPVRLVNSDASIERVEVPHFIGGPAWRLGGLPLAVQFTARDSVIRVHFHETGNLYYTFGPILPVIPYIWNAGVGYPFAAEIRLVSADRPVKLHVDEVRLRFAGETDGGRPELLALNCPATGEGSQTSAVLTGECVSLAQHEYAWLYFAFPGPEPKTFELELSLEFEGDPSRDQVRIEFERKTTLYLFHSP